MNILRPTAEAALAEWARRVQANAAQVDRVRQVGDGDFYAPVASMFRADPHRTGEPALELLRDLARPDETWLDIGAGGGRYALPLALRVREVIAVEPSEGMIGVLREGMAEHGIANVRVEHRRWPEGAAGLAADVALIAHVGYDIAEIGPFLDAMEAAARRLCVAVLLARPPSFALDALWPAVHGEPREALPALPEFLALLLARDRLFEIRLCERRPQSYESPEQVLALARRQTWVQPGSEADRRLQTIVTEHMQEHDGRYALSWEPAAVAVVGWASRQ
ncbi:MAG TPA: class I SAM-dependent methyltransferase [Dehalococcoidia bacterium]|nr:class I SAM-dependent methyltransferase [Dehalococcoidia bacterium]